ncbi:GAF domain-containing protein [Rhodococcoides corynebacterioides]|uniref:GAF domain-containing protein n=2 Tax=Rhodococcoides corynebacterioides TaxID=53972 RepID=UPI000833909C|nr:GAF domain-containing protein [Rhodococcus corynebacterioides]
MARDPQFDDEMAALLADQARAAGQTPEQYIHDAVLARLLRTPAGPTEAGRRVRDPNRLRSVWRTGLLDSPRAPVFERAVSITVESLRVPSAAIVLVDRDRVFYLGAIGLAAAFAEAREASLEDSLAAQVIESGAESWVVHDAASDARIATHPAVVGGAVGSYLAHPLRDADDRAVGALAAWHACPHTWTAGEQRTMDDLTWVVRGLIFGEHVLD